MIVLYSPDCAATKKIQIYENRLNHRLLSNFKILRSLKNFLEAAIMQEARFIFYALWQAPRARNFYRQRIALPLSGKWRRHREICA